MPTSWPLLLSGLEEGGLESFDLSKGRNLASLYGIHQHRRDEGFVPGCQRMKALASYLAFPNTTLPWTLRPFSSL